MKWLLRHGFVIIWMFALLFYVVFIHPNIAATFAGKEAVLKRFEKRSNNMGADVSIQLFNFKAYREKVIPAYQALLEKDDPNPFITLLKEIIERFDSDKRFASNVGHKEFYEEAIEVLNGSVHYNPDDYKLALGERETPRGAKQIFVEDNFAYYLLIALCVPHDKGVKPEQDMSTFWLTNYLYERSEWIKDLFTFVRTVKGESLELAMGESSELLTKEDLKEFSVELAKVPPPEDTELKKEYDNLRALVKLALEDPDLTLVLSVG